MKKRMILFVCALFVGLCVTCISCSQNGGGTNGTPAGNVKAGSSEDPFANSRWTMYKGMSEGKIISFSGNKMTYGNDSYSVGIVPVTGVYSVVKDGSNYTAYCRLTIDGETGTISLKISSASASSGTMYLEGTAYYTVYKY